MFEILVFIALALIILAGMIYYINKRNVDNDNFLINEINHLKKIKSKTLRHLHNSLKEVDYLNMTYKYLGTSNSDSVCYKDKNSPLENCECHPSCKTCGYSKNPIGMNQCLVCKNGTKVNKLYNNGAGWCSSYQEKKTSDDDVNTTNSADDINAGAYNSDTTISSTERLNDITNRLRNIQERTANRERTTTQNNTNTETKSGVETCLDKFHEMCPTSSNWQECLNMNRQSLILSGCQLQLNEDGTATARYAPVLNPTYENANQSSNTGETPATVTKFLLKTGEVLNADEHLASENSKHYLYINMDGNLILKNKQNNREQLIYEQTSPASHLGPYKLKIRNTNMIVLLNKDNEIVWSVNPENAIAGPNTKLCVSDNGVLIFKDNNGNIRWDSNTANTGSSSAGSSSAGSPSTGSSSASSSSTDTPTVITPFQFIEPIFGVKKHSKCPQTYPHKAIDERQGTGKACSKENGVEVTRENSCALEGHYRGTGPALLPRCYDVQVGKSGDKYYKCPVETYPGKPTLNKYAMVSPEKCIELRDGTEKYGALKNTVDITGSFTDDT